MLNLYSGYLWMACGWCSCLTLVAQEQTTSSVGRQEAVQSYRDLPYVEAGHARQKLDLYLPAAVEAPCPLIIWIHGGGWATGDKSGCPPLRDGYVQRGFAVASLGYRLSGDATFPAQLEDCKAAVRWLRAHADQYRLDPDKFAAWGSSAGGHLVALLGTTGDTRDFDVGAHLEHSSAVQAVCDFFGPTDFLQMDAHALAGAKLVHDAANSPESRLIGGPIQELPERVAKANPITYVSADDPPFLMVHGDQDPLVPLHQSQLLFEALRHAGVAVHFHTLQGAGHGTGFGGEELGRIVRDFFDQHLRGKPAASAQPRARSTTGQASQAAAGARANAGPPANRLSWQVIARREDANDDGRVTKEEFKGPPRLFARLDRNGDGVLTSADFSEP